MEVFYVRELAKRTNQGDHLDVVINCVNPGLCQSELAREGGLGLHLIKLVFARTTEVGSRTLVTAAQGDRNTHGEYMSNCRVEE